MRTAISLALAAALAAPAAAADKPLSLHPDNPHYFLFRGKPAVLLTSGEHYGAVLNLDFDYIPYLDELKERRFNLTRTFSGTYREDPSAFGIVDNTLAPKPKRFLCPSARSSTPGRSTAAQVRPQSLRRRLFRPSQGLRRSSRQTRRGRRAVAVLRRLRRQALALSPMKADNNVNGVGKGGRLDLYNLKDKELTDLQEALSVRSSPVEGLR